MQSVHWMKEKSNAVCELSSGIYKSFFKGIFEKKAGNLSISVSCRAALGTAA